MKTIHRAPPSRDHLTQVCINRIHSPNFARPPLGQQILNYLRTATTGKGGVS